MYSVKFPADLLYLSRIHFKMSCVILSGYFNLFTRFVFVSKCLSINDSNEKIVPNVNIIINLISFVIVLHMNRFRSSKNCFALKFLNDRYLML